MGEEKEAEGNKEQEKKEEDAGNQEIVLKVDMHCEACAKKVARSLKCFEGVEEVTTDCKSGKVVVKGKAVDPTKVFERIQRKSGRKVELISPSPAPPSQPPPPEEVKQEQKEDQKDEKKEEPPKAITMILQVRMHCEACAQALLKHIRKIPGVTSVEADVANDKVIMNGTIDPAELVENIYKRTRKHVSIVKDEEKKEEEKNDKKETEKKVGGEEAKATDEAKIEVKRYEYMPARYNMEYYTYPEIFSDENPNACSIM